MGLIQRLSDVGTDYATAGEVWLQRHVVGGHGEWHGGGVLFPSPGQVAIGGVAVAEWSVAFVEDDGADGPIG